jgi:hypothetical protein
MKTLGAFELVSFEELGLHNIVAKIDTGAYTGAVHVTQLHEVEDAEGGKVLRFRPFGLDHEVQIANYRKGQIKSSNGSQEERYVITTQITLDGQRYPITISLSDRTAMRKGVLIGRRFIRENSFLIDVTKGTEYVYHEKDQV